MTLMESTRNVRRPWILRTTMLVTLAATFGRPACASTSDPVIASESGLIAGKRIKVGDKEVDAFLGVPYAAPPVGDLRFERPRPVTPWNGTYSAKEMPPPCWQTAMRFIEGVPLDYSSIASEDCLYLNVWKRPSDCAAECGDQHKRPVVVFIHGGGFLWGDSALFLYDPANFVALQDVVFVTFNYRLSALGFLSLERPELPGNMGLWDQNLALKWVHANAARFGGDPNEVTLIGQSAGGTSVGFHAASPQSRGLFKRAFMMSGSPLSFVLVMSHRGQGKFVGLASSLGCYDAKRSLDDQLGDALSCLKKLEASVIYKTIEGQGPMQQVFPPVWGDEFNPENPLSEDTLKNLDVKEIVLGNVLNEGTIALNNIKYVTPVVKQILAADYRLAITTVIQPMFGIGVSLARRIVEAYLGNYDVEHTPEQVTAVISQLLGDAVFDCPAHLMSELTSAQKIPTYRYVFAHRPSHSFWPEWMGVAHADDIMYVLGSLPFMNDRSRHIGVLKGISSKHLANNYAVQEQRLMEEIVGAVYSFAKTGKPVIPRPDVQWPEYTPENPRVLMLQPNNYTVVQDMKRQRCELWKPVYYRNDGNDAKARPRMNKKTTKPVASVDSNGGPNSVLGHASAASSSPTIYLFSMLQIGSVCTSLLFPVMNYYIFKRQL